MNLHLSKSKLWIHPFTGLLQLSAFCIALIALRYWRTDNYTYFFLAWNLFLAWVPLFFAWVWRYRLQDKPLRRWKSFGMFGLWLLFFPNSPYLITDLTHLNNGIGKVAWSDILLLFSCAFTGLVVGLYSLYIVHNILERSFKAVYSWLIILGSLVLTGFGIYLGRVQRWNSWDLFTNPASLIEDIFVQVGNPDAIKMAIGFAVLLFIIYYMALSMISYAKSDK